VTSVLRRITPGLFGIVVAGSILAGCASDGPVDAIKDMNPFREEERLLPGERKPVLTGTNPIAETTNQPARVGPATPRTDWPQPGGPASNDAGNVAASVSGGRAWSVKAGQSEGSAAFGFGAGGIRLSARPVAAGGVAYTYDPSGNVAAISLSNGGSVWRVSARPAGESKTINGGGVAVDGGRVFAATGFAEVVALDAATGARVWATRLDAPTRGAPTAAAGKVFAVSQAGTVSAIDQATGAIAWTTSTTGRGTGLLSSSSPAVSGSIVVVPTSTGEVVALDIATGTEKWAGSVIGGSRVAAVTGLQDASASPVIADGVVYATGVGGRTIAVRLDTGETVWQQTVGGAHTPVVSGNALFLVDLEDRLVAFDRANGKVLWATTLPKPEKGRASWAGPLLVDGRLWLVSRDGWLVSADATTGQAGQATPLMPDGGISPVSAGGLILVLGPSGTLTAIR
jgi:outer membrane protein assembly factor BamB